jgi:hypothetical protein
MVWELSILSPKFAEYITAAGALGTASYAVVDGSKAVRGIFSHYLNIRDVNLFLQKSNYINHFLIRSQT